MRGRLRRRTAVALSAAALALTACTGGPPGWSGLVTARDPVVTGGDGTAPRACDDGEQAALTATVTAQLDALAAGDFAGAYAWASTAFRAGVGLPAFEQVIRTGYPELLSVALRRVEGCQIADGRGTLVVGITLRTGARRVLGYRLSEEREGWRIDGAGDVVLRRASGAGPSV
jgi:hypothetical protein